MVGAANVLADDESRIRHTRGKSTPDLLRLRSGDASGAPDVVLLPASHEEVLEVLRICSSRRIAVVPFGGGTSVVGGLEPLAQRFDAVVTLDLRRMNALVELDEQSRVAVLEPGLRGPEAEALLGERGYTIGHFPQSFEYATLGGFAAAFIMSEIISVGGFYFSQEIGEVLAFALFIGLMFLRPQGIFGRA